MCVCVGGAKVSLVGCASDGRDWVWVRVRRDRGGEQGDKGWWEGAQCGEKYGRRIGSIDSPSKATQIDAAVREEAAVLGGHHCLPQGVGDLLYLHLWRESGKEKMRKRRDMMR